jgi:hypothetical protein
MKIKYCFFAIAAAILLAVNSASAATIFTFDSSPISWVGQGESIYVTPDDDYLFTPSGDLNHVSVLIASYNSPFGPEWDPSSGDPYNYWRLDLTAPFDDPLGIGLYENTARYPFQDNDQPGLTLSGNHRGNNRNSGFFEILDIDFSEEGLLNSLAVDFTQYGEEQESRWITGSLRLNSDVAVVPLPGSVWLILSFIPFLLYFKRKS